MKSILSNDKRCYICGSQINLHRHHCLYGNPNRQKSEEHGLWVWLCLDHHTGFNGVHNHHEMDLALKKEAQAKFEETHSREEFREIFGKSYL